MYVPVHEQLPDDLLHLLVERDAVAGYFCRPIERITANLEEKIRDELPENEYFFIGERGYFGLEVFYEQSAREDSSQDFEIYNAYLDLLIGLDYFSLDSQYFDEESLRTHYLNWVMKETKVLGELDAVKGWITEEQLNSLFNPYERHLSALVTYWHNNRDSPEIEQDSRLNQVVGIFVDLCYERSKQYLSKGDSDRSTTYLKVAKEAEEEMEAREYGRIKMDEPNRRLDPDIGAGRCA